MAANNALKIFNMLKAIAILSFVVTCGSCLACNSAMQVEYGPEEFYRKPGGGIGYGAKTYISGEHPYDYIAIFSGILFIISSIGALAYRSHPLIVSAPQPSARKNETPERKKARKKWEERKKYLDSLIDR
jgi:hypothetical protein